MVFQWEVMSNEEVLEIVSHYDDPQLALREVSKEVTNRCKARRMACDNTTVVLVFFVDNQG